MKRSLIILLCILALTACSTSPRIQDTRLLTGCAHIRYGAHCGLGGSEAYVVNDRHDQSVRATVREHWHQGVNQGHNDRVYPLPAGGEAFVGCTRSSYTPVVQSTFEVIGCEAVRPPP